MKKITGVIVVIGFIIQGCGLFSDYGNKLTFGAGEVFYKDGVTHEEAEKLGNYLLQQAFFDDESPKSVQIVKKDGTYIFRMVTQESYIRDEKFERTVQFITMDLSADVFDNAKVDVHLTNETFETQKEVPFFGVKKRYANTSIYRSLDVDATTADQVTDYLTSIGFIDEVGEMTISYRIEGDDFIYEFIANDKVEYDTEVIDANKAIAGLISAKILSNKPIRMNFLFDDFSVKKSYSFEEIHQSYMEFLAQDSIIE